MTIQCETANVTVDWGKGGISKIPSIPAFTRSPESFKNRATELVDLYLTVSKREGQLPSIADFAFYLLTTAALFDPREQP